MTVQVAGALAGFGSHLALARLLGGEQFGVYVYALVFLQLLALFSTLGTGTSLVRFVAAYRAESCWGLLAGVLRRSWQIVALCGAVVAVLGIVVVRIAAGCIEDELELTFIVALATVPLLAVAQVRSAALRGMRHVVIAGLPINIVRPLLIVALVAGWWFLSEQPLAASRAMGLNLVATAAVLALSAALLFSRLPAPVRGASQQSDLGEWIRVSLPIFLIAGMHLVFNRTDIIMIGAIDSTYEAGLYSAATRMARLALFGLTAVNAIAAPLFSELHTAGRLRELRRLAVVSSRYVLVFTAVVAAVLAASGRYALGLFGEEFVVSYVPLLVLLVGQLVNGFCGSIGFLMTMTGMQNRAALIVAVCAALNIALNAVLIPRFGATGAAAATGVSIAVWNVAMVIVVRRKLGFLTVAFGRA